MHLLRPRGGKSFAVMKNEQIRSNVPKMAVYISMRKKGAPLTDQYCPLHYHDELEFIVINSGKFETIVDDESYFAEAGDVVFINSGVPHSTKSTASETGLIQFRENDFFNTDITRIIKYSVKFNNLNDSKIRIIKNKELFESLQRILSEHDKKDAAYEIFIRSEIYKALALLYRMKILVDTEEFFATKEVQKILPAIEYVNRNYNEEISLEAVSAMLGFDPSYFCRIFKTATGATFTEYLNFVRICKAEKMLSRTANSILEISETVGFSSVSYFNRVFKKYRNCSPRNYRLAEYKNI